MIKLRKRETPFVTIRVEDLQIGDRFVYDYRAVEVLSLIQNGRNALVILGTTHPGTPKESRTVELANELLITVARY